MRKFFRAAWLCFWVFSVLTLRFEWALFGLTREGACSKRRTSERGRRSPWSLQSESIATCHAYVLGSENPGTGRRGWAREVQSTWGMPWYGRHRSCPARKLPCHRGAQPCSASAVCTKHSYRTKRQSTRSRRSTRSWRWWKSPGESRSVWPFWGWVRRLKVWQGWVWAARKGNTCACEEVACSATHLSSSISTINPFSGDNVLSLDFLVARYFLRTIN